MGSTDRAAALGDLRWRDLLERHHAVVRRRLAEYRGEEMGTAGDGFFAMFDGPARAIRSARAIRDDVRSLGLEVRAGLHTGEGHLIDGQVGGIAVHIAARVASQAGGGEVLVSRTVKDLVAGSGFTFDGPRSTRAQGRARRMGAVRGRVAGGAGGAPAESPCASHFVPVP